MRKVENLKCIIENMKEIEEGIYAIEDCDGVEIEEMIWESETAEIRIKEIDIFHDVIEVVVYPRADTGKRVTKKKQQYRYKIEGNGVSCEFFFSYDANPIRSDKKEADKVLKELISILNPGKLTLKVEGRKEH